MTESNKKLTTRDIYGEAHDLTEQDVANPKRLKSYGKKFAEKIEEIIEAFPDCDPEQPHQSRPLQAFFEGQKVILRAVKEIETWEKFGRIHYLNANYKLIAGTQDKTEPQDLFTFLEIYYPSHYSPTDFWYGDTRIANHNDKLANRNEVLEGLNGAMLLSEQLEEQAENY